MAEFQRELQEWYKSNRREFPWRNTSEPYAILVAEKLLQQTAARQTVIEAYQTLLKRYPNPATLSVATVEEVEDIIRPLGLVYRARELITMGQEILQQHNGTVPNDLSALMSLTGVGSYVARAVLCFSFGFDVPVVDTNVARFLYRIYDLPGDLPSNPARSKKLLEMAANLVPTGLARQHNFAILDLCAEICTARNPKCEDCPVLEFCAWGLKQITSPP